jgi:hypothetical protein
VRQQLQEMKEKVESIETKWGRTTDRWEARERRILNAYENIKRENKSLNIGQALHTVTVTTEKMQLDKSKHLEKTSMKQNQKHSI